MATPKGLRERIIDELHRAVLANSSPAPRPTRAVAPDQARLAETDAEKIARKFLSEPAPKSSTRPEGGSKAAQRTSPENEGKQMATRQENEQNAATLRELRAKAAKANEPTIVARCDVLLKAIASNMADAERALAAAPPEIRRAYREAEIEARLTPGDRALLAKAAAPPPERSGFYTREQAAKKLAEMDAAKIAQDAADAFPSGTGPSYPLVNDDRPPLTPDKPFKTQPPYYPSRVGSR
jgi:hypothetical protein